MNRFAVLALAAPLFAAGSLKGADNPPAANHPPAANTPPMPGGFTEVKELNNPAVLKAQQEIQQYFVDDRFHLAEVKQAWTQVVAGTKLRLRVAVTANGKATAEYEFDVWHTLKDKWLLIRMERVTGLVEED